MDIICYSDIPWHFLRHRHQQILSRLPNDWNILFVEPLSIWSLLKNPKNVFPKKISHNISIVSLPIAPILERSEKLSRINDSLIIYWSRYLITKLGFEHLTLLFYEPRFSCVIGKLNEALVWYEVVDDRLSFENVQKRIKVDINNLISRSNVITTSSDFLFQKLSKLRKNNLYYVGNGVDSNHFAKALTDTATPQDIMSIKKPILGYIGTVAEWFDIELVKKVLRLFPNISVVIIGHMYDSQKNDIRNLTSYPNFHFLGEKDYDLLPNYLREFTACIIPFKTYELTMGVNPIKWYESCAAGKKTISTYLPSLEPYRDDVYMSMDHEEFLKNIHLLLDGKVDIQKLITIAMKNDWNNKVIEIKNILSNYSKFSSKE